MPVDTYIDRARTRTNAEREAVDDKRAAYGTFIERISELQTDPAPSTTSGITAAGGAQLSVDPSAHDRCRTVRTAFAETIRPHSVDDTAESESLLETIRAEFTDTIAVALAPTTEAAFTSELKQMVLAEARSRRSEATALRKALELEAAHLDEASTVVDEITAWIVEADETPLTDLDFDALARRHEKLTTCRDRCEELAHRRQEFLQRTTSEAIEAGVRHRSLVPYLYWNFPVDHPVLATVVQLEETCTDCQRAVRRHLVRRA